MQWHESWIDLAAATGVLWIAYTVLLWLLLKIQKMNYSVLGLLGCGLAGALSGWIPVVGDYVPFVVLAVLVQRMTRASMAPDVLFTVVICNALMFCFKLWGLAALMGDLRPDLADSFDDPAEAIVAAAQVHPNHSNDSTPSKSAPLFQWAKGEPDKFTLKGISLHRRGATAMIRYGEQLYTLNTGDVCAVRTDQGPLHVRCETITRKGVELMLNGKHTLTLSLP